MSDPDTTPDGDAVERESQQGRRERETVTVDRTSEVDAAEPAADDDGDRDADDA